MTTFSDSSPPKQRQPLRISTDLPLLSWPSDDSPPGSYSPTNQSLTPSATTPSTGNLDYALHVLCIYDFDSPDPDHLCFSKDEVLSIIKKEDSGWWAAMRPQGDRIGWIPSSFVQPLTSEGLDSLQTAQDQSRVVDYSNETLWAYEAFPEFSDSPQTATLNSWVRVSEDQKVQVLQLVTPTDLISQNDFLDDANGEYTHASFVDLSDENRFSSPRKELGLYPPIPHSPAPHSAQRPHFLPNSRCATPSMTQLASPAQSDGVSLRRNRRPRGLVVDDQASLLRLSKLLDSDSVTPDCIVDLYAEPSGVFRSAPASQECTYRDKIDVQVKLPGLPASPRPGRINPSFPSAKVSSQKLYLNLAIWNPDSVAEYLCVLMHALYASIRQHECLGWIRDCKIGEQSNLRHFFNAHDRIASWVQKCILMHDDPSKRTEALGFWIHVAEKCLVLRNHDSLGAIILPLTAVPVSSLGSTHPQKQTLIKLSTTVDVANGFNGLVNVMDETDGPSVPFLRAYLDHIKSFDVERVSDHNVNVVSIARRRRISGSLSNMLRHQSVPYDLEVARSTRRFVDDQLQDASTVTSSWLLARSQEIRQAELGGLPTEPSIAQIS